CVICLTPHRDIMVCNRSTLGSGSPTLVRRDGQRLVWKTGGNVCLAWQLEGKQCTQHHMCSGCKSTSHGASRCPRASK
ncbi:hypothetical protein CYLTODRAFT_318226, partial [Cylindrobasidium torrendii FP15055 ss-10]